MYCYKIIASQRGILELTKIDVERPLRTTILEEIENMEKRRSQAIEALEISDSHVKCQRCGIDGDL